MTADAGRPDAATTETAGRIVRAVYDYRFLTAAQLTRLFQLAPDTVSSIVQRLVEGDHLAAIKRPVLDRVQPDTVYALAQRGANQVAADLGIDRELVRWRKYHNVVGLPFVEHRLATNDVRIAFAVGAGLHGYVLEAWSYEVPIKEEVDDPDTGAPPLILRPDAYLRLLVGERRLHLFLEVDMATETHARFARKIRRYLAYRAARLFQYRVGGRSFRVLVAVPTGARVRSLKRVTEAQGGRRIFWFAKLGDITAEAITHPVWRLAGEASGAALFGSGEAQAA